MSRPPAHLPLAVFLLCAGGTWALAQPPGGGHPVDSIECKNCGHIIPLRDGEKVTRCPNCGTEFSYVVNPDGTKTPTGASAGTGVNPKKIAYGVGAAILLLAAVLAIVKLVTGGGAKPKKKGKGKKKRRPVVRESEDDE
jgi:predicted  nucleic acid-binding Zn-ribbon protein